MNVKWMEPTESERRKEAEARTLDDARADEYAELTERIENLRNIYGLAVYRRTYQPACQDAITKVVRLTHERAALIEGAM